MSPERAWYSGHSRKLVVALDIGTTFSGAAYALLDPGQVPQIRSVTRYLNNPNPGSAKVSSVLYYDHRGKFRGVENGVDFQNSDGLLRMKWWKMMLSPSELPVAMKDRISTELPRGKTIVDVFADYMRYLFDSTKELFKPSEPYFSWNSISNIELVLSHPNGWGGPQQSQLRSAAIKAGIVSDTPVGRASVQFVTEGEACFNFCATEIRAGEKLKPGEQVLIIDAGGGTIDISTYNVVSNGPLRAEELYEPKCFVQGGELVTARATAMMKEKLAYSKFNNTEDLAAFSQKFDEGVKKIFSTSNSRADQHVKFGSPRDNDLDYGIKVGRITLTGAQVCEFFEPSIQSTVDCILALTPIMSPERAWYSEDTPPRRFSPSIVKYTGALASPKREDVEPDKFKRLCHIKADISGAGYTSKSMGATKTAYSRNYEIILLVGLTELKVQVSWIDSKTGEEKRSDAVIVYDDPSWVV